MSLSDEINKRIKEEIEKDPYNIGYKNMSDEQIKEALNSPYVMIISSEIIQGPPINRILAGLESAPNAIAEVKNVTDAKSYIDIKE